MTNVAPAIRVEVRDAVAHLTLARAEVANTMNLQFVRELLAAALSLQADPRVRAAVLSGEGRNFCFGGDLKGIAAAGEDLRAYVSDLTTALHAALAHLMHMDAPAREAQAAVLAAAQRVLVLFYLTVIFTGE
ncbi:MAG: enoyl-CoA hydratase/isomerase family protein [Steroidobacteraceae bacterium]|jgi:2-(1,2-epoxy-1,2-dihydrophenyl)acetyl-CoA isomerase